MVFTVGQGVYLLLPTNHNKLLLQWRGPYRVTRVQNRMDHEIDNDGNKTINHARLLKECIERDNGVNDVNDDKDTDDDEDDTSDEEGAERLAAKFAVVNEPCNGTPENTTLSFLEMTQTETISDVNINPELSQTQTEQITTLLEEYDDIFSDVPGCTTLGEHKIELTTNELIRVRPYPMLHSEKKGRHN